jgi:hypothetical protein
VTGGVLLLLSLLFFAFLLNAAYLASALAAARLAGARVEVARLGLGPALLGTSIAGTRIELGLLPTLAYVKLEGMVDTGGPPVGFRAMHPLRRVAVVVGSWVLPALIAVLAIGPGPVGHHLVTALPQLFVRVFDTQAGVGLVRAFLALSFPAALGVLATKLVAYNLLTPLPSLSGGLVLRYLLAWVAPATDRDGVWNRVGLMEAPVMGVVCIRWIYVLYRALAE